MVTKGTCRSARGWVDGLGRCIIKVGGIWPISFITLHYLRNMFLGEIFVHVVNSKYDIGWSNVFPTMRLKVSSCLFLCGTYVIDSRSMLQD